MRKSIRSLTLSDGEPDRHAGKKQREGGLECKGEKRQKKIVENGFEKRQKRMGEDGKDRIDRKIDKIDRKKI